MACSLLRTVRRNAKIELHSLLHGIKVNVMSTSKYWPIDTDPEGQIYDNVAWDLPGFRAGRVSRKVPHRRQPRSAPALCV